MKKYFKDYFTFNKRERNGAFVLLLIILLLLLATRIISVFEKSEPIQFSEFEKQIDAFYNEQMQIKHDASKDTLPFKYSSFHDDADVAPVRQAHYSFFNPNNLPAEKWKELGLTDKQIKTIYNFESKGGKFRKKEDFKKMYCINEDQFTKLEPFILIPEVPVKPRDTAWKKEFKPLKDDKIIVELNSADTNQLIKIRGIGAGFARKIVKYRNRLGGFVKKEQLMEVYGLDSVFYKQIECRVSLNPRAIDKININTADVMTFVHHPYFEMGIAKAIVNYRSVHGKFTNIADIKKVALVYEAMYKKIAPYLSVD